MPEPVALDSRPAGGAGTLLWALVALAWVGAFMPDPWVIATLPGMFGMLRVMERCQRFRNLVGLIALFGALGIGFGYRWLAPTVEQFSGGRVGTVGSWALAALFGVVGTIHIIVFAVVYRALLRGNRRPHPLVTVALFVACESLPIRLFPWMAGHGAVNAPPLLQSASWGGVPAVSFVLLALIVPVHEMWASLGADRARARVKAATFTFVVGAALFGWGHVRWEMLREQDERATERVVVGIVQPDIGAGEKRGAERGYEDKKAATIAAYKAGSQAALDKGAELIVWPETAITDPIRLLEPKFDAANTRNTLSRYGWGFLDELGTHATFLVGAYEQKALPPGAARSAGARDVARQLQDNDQRYNVAALRPMGPSGPAWSVYRKTYLIPFGETMPLGLPQSMLPQGFLMRPAPTPSEALVWNGRRVVPFLCYEGILPEHVRETAGAEVPDLLVSLTNDSWFGDTWEPHQHLNFTRFRAVEHAAPLVRATNTGISAFVTASGDVVETLGVGKEGVLVRPVPMVDRGRTLYARYGYRMPWALGAFVLLALLVGPFLPGGNRRTD
ncbi:MAG: apolipoprotein N-acyltransferase [Planctomycetes bacterium]|nr:apolipoprotein N-acyltransferase [Planctomycetota bacterium]